LHRPEEYIRMDEDIARDVEKERGGSEEDEMVEAQQVAVEKA